MTEIINLQTEVELDVKSLGDFASTLADQIAELDHRTFSIAIVPDSRMLELNKLFRGKTSTTDVLSFPRQPDDFDPDKNNLGDIVISAEQARRQAAENDLSIQGEIKQLILHGVLHLCGHDHETDDGEMNARELELREVLGI